MNRFDFTVQQLVIYVTALKPVLSQMTPSDISRPVSGEVVNGWGNWCKRCLFTHIIYNTNWTIYSKSAEAIYA